MTVNGWTRTDLAAVVATIQSGSRPKGGAGVDTGEIPSLGGENILQSGGVTLRDVKRVPTDFFRRMTKGHLQHRDVLINKDGAQTGKVGIYTDGGSPACINEHLFLIRGHAHRILPEFLYYTLLSEDGQRQIAAQISGSAQPGLKSNFLSGVVADVPDLLDEQATITVILRTLDQAIESTEKLISKRGRLHVGLRHNLVTRGIDEKGILRSEATHAFKDSPLGRVPDEWGIDIFERITPRDAPIGYGIVQPGAFDHAGVPVAGIYTINSDFERWHMSSRSIECAYRRSRIQPGDVLLSIKGTTGRVGIVPPGMGGNISREIARIRPDERWNPHYLRFLMLSTVFQRYLSMAEVGTTRAEISIKILRQLSVLMPPKLEQDQIVLRLQAIEQDLHQLQRQLSKALALKTAFMQDLLTGKRRVPPLLKATSQATGQVA